MIGTADRRRPFELKIAEEAGIDLVFLSGPMMRHLYDRLPASRRGGYAPNSNELAETVAAGSGGTMEGPPGQPEMPPEINVPIVEPPSEVPVVGQAFGLPPRRRARARKCEKESGLALVRSPHGDDGGWARWRELLAPTLDAADVALVGLGAVFPGVEAIREFKGALATAVSMSDG